MRGRSFVGLACLGVLGVLSSQAVAQVAPVGIPTVTVPTVTLPVPVPTVTLPLPGDGGGGGGGGGGGDGGGGGPSVPSDPVGDAADKLGDAVDGLFGGSGKESGSGGSGKGSGNAGSGNASAGKSGGQAKPSRRDPELRASHKKFKNRRQRGEPYGTTLSFWVAKRGLVRFFIRQEAPACREVGWFDVRAKPGVNRVRFLGRHRRKLLPPGTYTITAIAIRPSRDRSLGTVTVVIVPRNRETEDARRQPSRCGVSAMSAARRRASATSGNGGAGDGGAAVSTGDKKRSEGVAGATAAGAGFADSRAPRDGHVFGGAVPNPFEGAPGWLQASLLAALAVAILLLLAAALPARVIQPTAAATLIEYRRIDLAFAGAAILGAVAIAALLV